MTDTKIFNLAYGGATIDSKLVTPYLPTVLWERDIFLLQNIVLKASNRSIVDQVSLFDKYLASKPAGAQWSSDNSLFTFWIGINDVVRD